MNKRVYKFNINKSNLHKGGSEMIRIRTLLDNVGTEHKTIVAKHGLAMYVETETLKLIFDCGPDVTAVDNARLMDTPIQEADYVILSHSHYDHSGGYPDFVKSNVKGILYTGPDYFEPKYAYDGVKYTYLGAGFNEEFLDENRIAHKVCRGTIQLAKDCWIFSDFPRKYEFETIPERFVRGQLPNTKRDDFSDEVCLAVDTAKGLVVVVGCSHPGILNMLEHIYETLQRPIYAVLGGTHLVEANEQRIEQTIKKMKDMGLKIIGLSHCSGEKAECAANSDEDIYSCHLGVGDCFALE